MIEREPKPPELPVAPPRIDLPEIEEIYFDIDEEMHQRDAKRWDFPLDDYEDLSNYLEPYQNG